jgi:Icc-related predicted phosphoesterase
MGLFTRERRRHALRLFFATDVHGSDRCFRKFLAAAAVYEAQVLVLGGDVIGKAIVPIEAHGADAYEYTFQGATRRCGEDELAAVREAINFNGFYPLVISPDERDLLVDETTRAQAFERVIVDQLTGWLDLAETRLDDGVRCIVTPGNDDPRVIDPILRSRSTRVECPEQDVVPIGPIALASLGNTNRTPWDTEREYDEDELALQIDGMLASHDGGALVVNFHCPPFDSGLDVAAELDDEFRPVLRNGQVSMIPVGSTAVRHAIERYGPAVGLHGHIHESAGMALIGRTACFNPGSDYSSGVLKGLIVDFDDDGGYVNHLFTSG